MKKSLAWLLCGALLAGSLAGCAPAQSSPTGSGSSAPQSSAPSADPGELLQATDRIYVLYGGSIATELVTTRTCEEEIMYYAVGGKAPFLPSDQREREELF